MSLLIKALKHQEVDSFVHREDLFLLKIFLLLLSYISIIINSHTFYLALIISSVLIMLAGRAYKIVFESIGVYAPVAFLIYLINLAFNTVSLRMFAILIYGYTVFVGMLMIVSTTPRKQFLRILEKLRLDVVFFMTLSILEEFNEMLNSKRARGWDAGLNVLKYYVIIVDAIKLSIVRLRNVEDSLLARGVERF
uniref:Cobalt transport protein n=1 Tax=Thermosphaera aggregans TaxID=54254 RepID=A0A7C2FH57_9CREN